jgi:hypothetical protein
MSRFNPSLIFADKFGTYQSGAPYMTQLQWLAPRLAWSSKRSIL